MPGPPQPRAEPAVQLALFEPDSPQNVGAMLRLGACLGVPVEIIEPCGFVLDDRRLRRAGMDYVARATMTRHRSWDGFMDARASGSGRLLLLTTRAAMTHHAFVFQPADTVLVGRESAAAPEAAPAAADAPPPPPTVPGARPPKPHDK